MAEMVVAGQPRLFHHPFHRLAVVAMEGVALDDDGADLFAAENMPEGARNGGRTGPRRAGNGDYGMFDGHGSLLS